MIKVLFVCLGNICRSPLAEAIFDHKVKERKLDHLIQSDSCGTSNYHIGKAPDPRRISCAQGRGILIDHAGRQISPADIDEFDYLIVMDQSNLKNVRSLMQQSDKHHPHLYLMREFQPDAAHTDVPDPYYGDAAGFEEVYDILDESIDHLIDKIKQDHQL
jgi:protein-tyrosine phosphatase